MREGQIAKFVEDDEVHARQMIGEPSLPTVAGFGLSRLTRRLMTIPGLGPVTAWAVRAGLILPLNTGRDPAGFSSHPQRAQPRP